MEKKEKMSINLLLIIGFIIGMMIGFAFVWSYIHLYTNDCKERLNDCVDIYNTKCIADPMLPIHQPINITFGGNNNGK